MIEWEPNKNDANLNIPVDGQVASICWNEQTKLLTMSLAYEVQNSGFKEFVSNTWIQYSTLGLDSELGGAARYYIDHYYDFFEQMQGGLYAD